MTGEPKYSSFHYNYAGRAVPLPSIFIPGGTTLMDYWNYLLSKHILSDTNATQAINKKRSEFKQSLIKALADGSACNNRAIMRNIGLEQVFSGKT